MTSTTTFIYALTDPRTNEVRYVGKANDPKKRYSKHICLAKTRTSCHRLAWINSLHKLSIIPILTILEECAVDIWGEREEHWIGQFHNLTNQLDGGKFCPMTDPAIVAKMKETKRLNPQKCSDVTRKKLSEHSANLWRNGTLKRGRKQGEAEIMGRTNSLKAFWQAMSPEERKRRKPEGFKRPLKPVNKLTMTGDFICSYPSMRDAAIDCEIDASHVSNCCRNPHRSHKGFRWQFKGDEASDPMVVNNTLNN